MSLKTKAFATLSQTSTFSPENFQFPLAVPGETAYIKWVMNKNFKAQYTENLTEKQSANLAAWKRWGQKMQMMRSIHVELGRTNEVVVEIIETENEQN